MMLSKRFKKRRLQRSFKNARRLSLKEFANLYIELEIQREEEEAKKIFSNNKIIARKGTTYMDAGYIYAPYVPMETTPSINENQRFRISDVRTRYGGGLSAPGPR